MSAYASPARALRLIGQEPDARPRTPAELRTVARAWRKDAHRIRRTAEDRKSNGRVIRMKREADGLDTHAALLDLAAGEVERRGASTIGEALSLRRKAIALFRAIPRLG